MPTVPPIGRIRTKRLKLSDLTPAAYNPREIGADALAGLGESVERFGLVQPIVLNERTGRIVGGHQRLKVLEERGARETDVVLVDLEEAQEKALNLALNSQAIAGDWTTEALALLDGVAGDLPELAEALRLPDLREELLGRFPTEPDVLEDDPVPEQPKIPVTQPGDVWLLGRHRLVCGDATHADPAGKAQADDAPFLMVTDPPYGVEYAPEWRAEAGLNKNRGRMGSVRNDDLADWSKAYNRFSGDVAYVWHAGVHAATVHENLLQQGMEVRAQIIWCKPRFALSRGAYHWGHEPCWYAVRRGRAARWSGGRRQSTIWEVALAADAADDSKGLGHGTQKPVELMARPIRNHGSSGDTVYDPFLGSGTTLIAAEQLERRCVGLELDPGYCDVIVERWKALTGGSPRRG